MPALATVAPVVRCRRTDGYDRDAINMFEKPNVVPSTMFAVSQTDRHSHSVRRVQQCATAFPPVQARYQLALNWFAAHRPSPTVANGSPDTPPPPRRARTRRP